MESCDRIKIRLAVENDLPEVLYIEQYSFSSAWTYAFFKHEIYNPLSCFYVVETDSLIVGYIVFWIISGESHIANLAIHPDHRRLGYGNQLMFWAIGKSVTEGARSVTLEVNVNNAAALALYRHYGFKEVGKRLKYYENRDDALILTLNV